MQNPPPPRPTWQIGLLVLLGLGGVLAGALYARHRLAEAERAGAVPRTQAAAVYEHARPLPAFALTDDDGHPADGGVFRGRWSLLFFGYTHCPDACPATLAELAEVDRKLADLPAALRPQVWLLSVDPKRDTVEALHTYVRFFSPGFRALTGTPEAVQALTLALGIPVVFRNPTEADYVVDHSAAILLVNPAGELTAVFPAPHRVAVLSADYRAIVTAPARTP